MNRPDRNVLSLLPIRLFVLATLAFVVAVQQVSAQPPYAPITSGPAAKSTTGPGSAGSVTEGRRPSEAERIAGLEKLLTADRQRQTELEEQLARLETDFERASEEFTERDTQRSAARAAVEAATTPEQKRTAQAAVEAIEKDWKQTRDRFDLIIDRRKAVQQQLGTVAEKITLEEKILQRLKQPEVIDKSPEAAGVTQGAAVNASENKAAAKEKPKSEAASPLPSIPGLPSATAASAKPAAQPAEDAEPPSTDLATVDERVVAARREFDAAVAKLERARQAVKDFDDGILVFERDLAGAERLLETAQGEVAAAQRAAQQLAADLDRRRAASADESELAKLNGDLAREQQRLRDAQAEVTQQSTRVTESRAVLERMRGARKETVERFEAASAEVDSARMRLSFLNSPMAPHRVLRWITNTGPRVVVVVLVMIFVWWLGRLLARRVIAALVRRSRRGTSMAREQRAETLRRVFQYAVGLAVVTLGTLAVLNTSGIDVTVLLGGAAVIGAAFAFGSQNLIKDYFSGFMILAENQYSVGNIIKIAETTGTVEDITLRMTVLRDEEGVVHFIPHGQVNKVSNLTHDWSRAVFRIGVGYGEDVDRVMDVLLGVARELKEDEEFGPQILGEPEMQGVDSLDDSAVVIKLLVKTKPLQQWRIKRQLLRRIKQKFDELGIEIPFPQRVVHEAGATGRTPEPEMAGGRDSR